MLQGGLSRRQPGDWSRGGVPAGDNGVELSVFGWTGSPGVRVDDAQPPRSSPALYRGPGAAQTNDHRLSTFSLTVLRFRSLTWVLPEKNQAVSRAGSCWRLWGVGESIPPLLQPLGAPAVRGSPSLPPSAQPALAVGFLMLRHPHSASPASTAPFKDPGDSFGPIWII